MRTLRLETTLLENKGHGTSSSQLMQVRGKPSQTRAPACRKAGNRAQEKQYTGFRYPKAETCMTACPLLMSVFERAKGIRFW